MMQEAAGHAARRLGPVGCVVRDRFMVDEGTIMVGKPFPTDASIVAADGNVSCDWVVHLVYACVCVYVVIGVATLMLNDTIHETSAG